MTLAEISQVVRPSVVNKQSKLVSNTKARHKSHNLLNVGIFFSADWMSPYPVLAVLRYFQKSAVRL